MVNLPVVSFILDPPGKEYDKKNVENNDGCCRNESEKCWGEGG